MSRPSSDHSQSPTRTEPSHQQQHSPRPAVVSNAVILRLAQSLLLTSQMSSDETRPLISDDHNEPGEFDRKQEGPNVRTRGIVWGILTFIFLLGLVFVLFFSDRFADTLYPWVGQLPKDPQLAALRILDNAPVIVRKTLSLLTRIPHLTAEMCCLGWPYRSVHVVI